MTPKFARSVPIRALWLAVLTLAATGCPGPEPEPSAPLATFTGQLRAAQTGAAGGPLRLALAWYPGLMAEDGQPISQPRAIATQDVAYGGALPVAYTFEVEEAPPASALMPMPQGYTGRGAIGVLLAYQDGDGDHALDTIPATGVPVDHVVGASLDWMSAPAYLVVYLTDDQPEASGLKAGFNLLEIASAEDTHVVPLSTALNIHVGQGGPLLDLFVCDAAWDGSSTQAPCGLDLGEEPGEGVLDAVVMGELYASDELAEVAFGLTEIIGGDPFRITDATVTLDGVEIPFDGESGYYYTAALDPALFHDGGLELIATRGDETLRRTIAVPAFELQAPATVASGTDFEVGWTVPAAADSFDLILMAGANYYQYTRGIQGPSYLVTGIDYVGEGRVTVTAHASAEFEVTITHSTTVEFVVAENP